MSGGKNTGAILGDSLRAFFEREAGASITVDSGSSWPNHHGVKVLSRCSLVHCGSLCGLVILVALQEEQGPRLWVPISIVRKCCSANKGPTGW